MPILDIGEGLVDLSTWDADFLIDYSRKQIANTSPHFAKVRASVAEKLLRARSLLPRGIDFYIKEGYRSPKQQRCSYEKVTDYIRKAYPKMNEQNILGETNKLCAPPEVASHPTGGALDVTLLDKESGTELFLGTEYNAVPIETCNATFLDAENISAQEKGLRDILRIAMESAGFICYPPEWWHWSYGDKYWAVVTGADHALYGPITGE